MGQPQSRVRARRRRPARRRRGRHAAGAVRGRHRPGPRRRHVASARSTARWSPPTRPPGAVDRLAAVWRPGRRRRCIGARRCARLRRPRPHPHRTLHPHEPLRGLLDRRARATRRIEDLPVPFQCCAASIERAAEHWFDQRAAGRRGARVARGARAAAAGADRRRALPRRRHRQLASRSGGRSSSARGRVFVLQVGRIERPLTAPTQAVGGRVGGVRDRPPAPVRPGHGRPARRRRGARAADRRRRAAAHGDLSALRYRDFGRGRATHRPAPTAATAELPGDARRERRPDAAAARRWCAGVVLAPALVVLTVVAADRRCRCWLLVAAGAVAAAARPVAGRCGCSGWSLLYLVLEAVALVVLFGALGRLRLRLEDPRRRGSSARTTCSSAGSCGCSSGSARGCCTCGSTVEGPRPDDVRRAAAARLCRHAGPGDSFLLVHALVNWYAREPRIVLKDTLQWDPAIDVLLNRLPNRFIRPTRRQRADVVERQIGELGRGLDDNDAFVIFPEGGNFTEHRRAARSSGCGARASSTRRSRPRRMRHVLAPKPGGVLAALTAAPRRRRRVRRAHRPRPHVHRRRRLARAADGPARSRCAGGSCRPTRCPRARGARSTGCSTGGPRSTTGSTSSRPRPASSPRRVTARTRAATATAGSSATRVTGTGGCSAPPGCCCTAVDADGGTEVLLQHRADVEPPRRHLGAAGRRPAQRRVGRHARAARGRRGGRAGPRGRDVARSVRRRARRLVLRDGPGRRPAGAAEARPTGAREHRRRLVRRDAVDRPAAAPRLRRDLAAAARTRCGRSPSWSTRPTWSGRGRTAGGATVPEPLAGWSPAARSGGRRRPRPGAAGRAGRRGSVALVAARRRGGRGRGPPGGRRPVDGPRSRWWPHRAAATTRSSQRRARAGDGPRLVVTADRELRGRVTQLGAARSGRAG